MALALRPGGTLGQLDVGEAECARGQGTEFVCVNGGVLGHGKDAEGLESEFCRSGEVS